MCLKGNKTHTQPLLPKIILIIFITQINFNSEKAYAKTKESDLRNNAKIFTQAQDLAKNKKWKKAIALLEPLSERLPEVSLFNLSNYYGRINDFTSEIRHLNTLIELKPQSPTYHFHRGLAYSRLQSSQRLSQTQFNNEAISSLQKTIELKPTFRSAYTLLLDLFERTNNSTEARSTLLIMIDHFGERAEYFSKLCRLYIEDEFIDDGIRLCTVAITKSPKEPINHVFLARGYLYKENAKRAQSILSKATELFPKSAKVHEVNGEYHLAKKNLTTAIKYFRKAIAIDTNLADSHIGLAISLFEKKKYEEALTPYLNACKLKHSKIKEYRQAITKLRGVNNFKMSEKYENQIYKCQSRSLNPRPRK